MAASMCSVALTASAATKKITKLAAANTKTGIKLTWKKVKGVKTYKVVRGKKVLKTVKTNTFTDKTAKAGKSYTYKIQATGVKAASVKAVRLTAPKFSALKVTKNKDGYPNGIKITWKKVKGAKKYIVYRKDSKKYAKVKTLTKVTYTDSLANDDTKYSYKVKAVNGKSTSVASAAKSGVIPATTPKVTLKLDGNKYTLKWTKVKYASSYTVYDSNGKKVKTVKTNSLTGTLTGDNLQVVVFTVKTNYGGNTSWGQSAEALYIPDGSHYHDQYGNICIKIGMKKGEQFADGAFLNLLLLASGEKYTFNVDKGTDENVATLDENYVITANNAGFTKFTITYDETAAKIVTEALAQYGLTFNNKLSTGTAFVEVTVTD